MSDTNRGLREMLRGGGGFFLSRVLSQGLGILFVIVATHWLGASEFGILALGLSVFGVIKTVTKFGLDTASLRLISGEWNTDKAHRLGAFLVLGLLGGVLGLILTYTLSFPLAHWIFSKPRLGPVLRILAYGTFFFAVFIILRSVIHARKRVFSFLIANVLWKGGRVLFLCVLLYGWGAQASVAAGAELLAPALALTGAIYCVHRLSLPVNYSHLMDYGREILSYSSPMMLISLGFLVANQTDILMLGALSASSSVGIYAVVSRLTAIAGMVHNSLIQIFLPMASSRYQAGELSALQGLYRVMARWDGVVAAGILCGLLVAGRVLLALFGGEFSNPLAFRALLILVFGNFVMTWLGPTASLLQMAESHYIDSLFTVGFVVMNVILNLLLIPPFGVVGAALATAVSRITKNTFEISVLVAFYGINPLTRPHVVILIVTSLALGLSYLLNFYKPAVILLCAVAVVIMLSTVLSTLSGEEKELLAEVKGRIL